MFNISLFYFTSLVGLTLQFCTWPQFTPARPCMDQKSSQPDRQDRRRPQLLAFYNVNVKFHKHGHLHSRAMKNMHRPYFVLRAINSIGRILLLLQADDETTCSGLHTCFMVADLAGITSTCCSMDSFFRIRCSLLFWV